MPCASRHELVDALAEGVVAGDDLLWAGPPSRWGARRRTGRAWSARCRRGWRRRLLRRRRGAGSPAPTPGVRRAAMVRSRSPSRLYGADRRARCHGLGSTWRGARRRGRRRPSSACGAQFVDTARGVDETPVAHHPGQVRRFHEDEPVVGVLGRPRPRRTLEDPTGRSHPERRGRIGCSSIRGRPGRRDTPLPSASDQASPGVVRDAGTDRSPSALATTPATDLVRGELSATSTELDVVRQRCFARTSYGTRRATRPHRRRPGRVASRAPFEDLAGRGSRRRCSSASNWSPSTRTHPAARVPAPKVT